MRTSPTSSDEWGEYVRTIGTTIHRIRVERGYSQDRVAYEANLSRYTYQKLEKGETRPGAQPNPRLSTLLAIAQVLEVSLADLLPEEAPDLTAR